MSKLEKLLHDYVAGDLDAARRIEVERHLQDDVRARALLADIRSAHDALTSLRDRPAPPVSAKEALPKIEALITAQRFAERPKLYLDGAGQRYYKRVALAATLLLAVTVGLLVSARQNPAAPGPPDTAIDVTPSAGARGLVDAASAGPLDAYTALRLLEEAGENTDVSFSLNDGVFPVAGEVAEKR